MKSIVTDSERPVGTIEPKTVGAVLGLISTIVCAAFLVLLINRPLIVMVEGDHERTSELDVLAVVEPFLGSGLFGVDLSEVQLQVQDLPWVDRVRVQRRWPDKLLITVIEHVAAARWGDTGLLNTRGEVFISEARHIPPELPLLSGPDGSEWQVAQRYLEIRGQLIQTGLGLREITLSPRGAWRVTLGDEVEVRFGREQFQNRLERFVRFGAPMIVKHGKEIRYIDLRYGNGFAIGWSEQSRHATLNQEADSDV